MTKNIHYNTDGFTLLETVIALAILLLTMLPLISSIYRNNSLIHAEHTITGMCILEQEAMKVRCNPDQLLPFQRRIIEGDEWIISTETTGSEFRTITMKISKNNTECGTLVFHENRNE